MPGGAVSLSAAQSSETHLENSRRELLWQLFNRADEEGSGHVTVDQIYQAALEIGINTDRERINEWFAKKDVDRDGTLTWMEVLGFYVDPDEVNKIAFKVFDQDRDGKITKKEFMEVTKTLTEEQVDMVFRRIGKAKEGEIKMPGAIGVIALARSSKEHQDNHWTDCLWKLFNRADEDGTGHITAEQLYQAAVDSGMETDREHIESWFQRKDKDHSGTLTWREIMEFPADDPETVNKRAFQQFDHNHDGKISKEEFMSHCQSLTEEQVDAVFQRIGKAKEGEINYKEFCEMMNRRRKSKCCEQQNEGEPDEVKDQGMNIIFMDDEGEEVEEETETAVAHED